MPVKINDVMIVPAPIVTYSKNLFNSVGSGTFGTEYSIAINGNLIAYKGNPEATGSSPTVAISTGIHYSTYSPDDDPVLQISHENWLNSIMKKQEYLRAVVSSGVAAGSGVKLEITGFNESKGIKAYCDLDTISFDDQSRWTNTCGYSINLRTSRFIESANEIFPSGSKEDAVTYYISEADESWSIQELDSVTATTGNKEGQTKIYTLSHSVNAVGQRTYINGSGVSPVAQASGYVHNIIGLGEQKIPLNYLGLPSNYVVYDRKIIENISQFKGSYSIEEEFKLAPSGQMATEVFQASIENDLSSLTKISINGTVTGFNSSGVTARVVNRYENASLYWNSISGSIYDRANSYLDGGCSLNPVALSKVIGRNPQEGTISYSYSYDNRPANVIQNSLAEDIQVTDTYPGQIINVVPVIGRSQPIIQYLGARSEYKRSLQINASMPTSGCLTQKPPASSLSTIFEFYKPAGVSVYYSTPVESWNPKNGQYSYNIEWTFEQ